MKHLVLPDTQCRPGDDFRFLSAIGHYIVEKKPDVIIHLGDHADMPSLSSYDVGKKVFEGRRYKADIEAAKEAMENLLYPIKEFNERAVKSKHAKYLPRKVLTLGNHEERILRAINGDPKLDGTIGLEDLEYKKHGWEVHNYLSPVVLDGVTYCHYFTSGILGRPCSSAANQMAKKHSSCVAGHKQGLDIAMAHDATGKRLTSVIAGSCYEHYEDYLGPQGNRHWRGCLMLHNVDNGEFDLVPVPLTYLRRKYG